MSASPPALVTLRRKLAVSTVIQLVVGAVWLAWAAPATPGRWTIGAAVLAAYFVGETWRHLPDNRTADGTLSARIGPGTRVTFIRMWALALIAGYLPSPPAPSDLWLVAGLYGVVGAGDWLDGFLARHHGHETTLGQHLDGRVDGVGMLVAPAVAVVVGRLPPWYLVLGAAYFLFRGGLLLATASGGAVHEDRLRPSAHARAFAGCQMALVGAAFVPVLDAGTLWLIATVFMAPSLATFVRDWQVARGRLVPDTEAYVRLTRQTIRATRHVLPVVLRAACLAAAWQMTAPPNAAAWLWGTALVSVAVGLVPRLGAAVVLLLSALAPGETLAAWTVVATASALVLLGGGAWSLAQPEEVWLFARHGGGGSSRTQTTKRY